MSKTEQVKAIEDTQRVAEEAKSIRDKNDAAQTLQKVGQQQQQLVPTMSPEQVLLLQVLRRAKRQQDLIIEIQKNLKSLTNIQKGIEKTTEQMKQLQSAVKDSQKQTIQIQRQIAAVKRTQEKEFEKLRIQKRGGAILSVRGKVAKNRRKAKKLR